MECHLLRYARMGEISNLQDAISRYVRDGDSIAAEGFSHLIPFAAGHEIIRQRRRNLTLIRLTPDLIYDQMIGAGCARKMIFSWAGNPGVGLSPRFRDAIENGWPLSPKSTAMRDSQPPLRRGRPVCRLAFYSVIPAMT